MDSKRKSPALRSEPSGKVKAVAKLAGISLRDVLKPRADPPAETEQATERSNEQNTTAHALGKLAEDFGVRRRAGQWRNVAVKSHQLKDIGLANVNHMHDCFIRAETTEEGLDKNEFVLAFIKIDANGDERVSWEEFSSYVLLEALQKSNQHGRHGLQINVFTDPLPDDPYNEPSAYHREMIHAVCHLKQIGKYVTCGRDGTVRVWSSQTRRHLHTLQVSQHTPPSWITCCTDLRGMHSAHHPHSLLAIFSLDGNMQLYDLKSFGFVRSVVIGDGFSPLCCDSFRHTAMLRGKHTSRQLLVVGETDGTLLLFEQNEALLSDDVPPTPTTIRPHSDHVTQIKYVEEIDRIVSTSADSTVCLWDCVTNTTRSFRGHSRSLQCFTYCEPYKYIASGGQEREILLWNPYTLMRITSLQGHAACIQSIVFNMNHNHIISLATDKEIIVWDPKSYDLLCRVKDQKHYRPEDTFSALCWDPIGRLILAHSRIQVLPYRSDVTEHKLGIALHKAKLVAALYNSVFEKFVTVDLDGLVLVWDLENGEQTTAFSTNDQKFGEEITTASFDVSLRRIFVATSKGRVFVYNWNSGLRLNELVSGMEGEITCVRNYETTVKRFTVATGWDKIIFVWKDPPDSFVQQVQTTVDPGSGAEVLCMACLRDSGTFCVGMYDGKLLSWTTQGGSWRRKMQVQACSPPEDIPFEGRDRYAINCIVAMDGFGAHVLLFTGGMDGQIRILDSQDGSLKGQFDSGHVSEWCFDDDGQPENLPVVAMASDERSSLVLTGDSNGGIRGFEVSRTTDEVIWLQVRVISASGLISADANGFSDPYVKLQYGRQSEKTEVKLMTLEPVWEAEFDFRVGAGRRADILRRPGILTLRCMDYDRFAGHDALGNLSIDLKSLEIGEKTRQWYEWQSPSADFAHKDHGKVLLELHLSVFWHCPETFSSWKAHEGSITSIHITRPGSIDSKTKQLVVTSGQDSLVQLWTLNGEPVAQVCKDTWSFDAITKAIVRGTEKKAMALIMDQKAREKHKLADLGRQRRIAEARQAQEKEEQEKENAAKEMQETGQQEATDSKVVVASYAKKIIKMQPVTADVGRSYSKRLVTDIPEGVYDVLSQPLLNQILHRRGQMPEDPSLVFTRMRIEGSSDKKYPVKECANYGWDLGLLERQGAMTRQHVQYGMMDVEKVAWQDPDPASEGAEQEAKIPQKPHGTVSSLYATPRPGSPHDPHRPAPPRSRSQSPQSAAHGDTGQGALSRAPSRANLSRAPSRAALSRAPSRVAFSRAPSRNNVMTPTERPPRLPIGGGAEEAEAAAAPTPGGGQRKGGAAGITLNLKKMLTSSLPPYRAEGSWKYKDVELEEKETARWVRRTPRFDPTQYVDYSGASSARQDSLRHSPHRPLGLSSTLRPQTARSRIETTNRIPMRLFNSKGHTGPSPHRPLSARPANVSFLSSSLASGPVPPPLSARTAGRPSRSPLVTARAFPPRTGA